MRIKFFGCFALAASMAFASPLMAEETNGMAENAQDEVQEEEVGAAATEIRRGLEMGGRDGRSRTQIFYENLIEIVEPDLKGKPERLDIYLRHFQRTAMPDTKMVAWKTTATYEDGKIVLTGYSEFPQFVNHFENYLGYLGFENIDNQMEVLPSENLGDKKYAMVNVPFTYIYSRPESPRETETTEFLGDFIFLLREAENGYFLCHGSEGYIGYINGEHIHRVDRETFERVRKAPRATFLRDFDNNGDTIPAGAKLIFLQEIEDEVMVLLPDASMARVPADIVSVREHKASQAALAAIEVARGMLGTRYVWGGKTTDGVDCSGLTQTAWRSQGINLPRDAYMQAYTGKLSGTQWNTDGMLPGDLMFFINNTGRISHTAIYIGDDRYMEATSPVAKITSLNPDHGEEYSERRANTFIFAKRPFE